MGCFWGCFGGRKNRRRRQRRREESDQAKENKLSVESAKSDHVNVRFPTADEIPKASVIPITEICDEAEVKCSPSPTRKRVTFDSKVKTYEHIVVEVDLSEVNTEEVKSEERPLESTKTDKSSSDEIVDVALDSYPSNHRYKNCRESDDDLEEDELDCSESDFGEDEEYYSDVGFSDDNLHNPIEEVYTEETGDKTEEIEAKLTSSIESVKKGHHYDAQGVLNPVENLTQWKSAKSKGRTIHKQSQKENTNFISGPQEKRDSSSLGTDPQNDDITLSIKPKKLGNEDVAIDASLSTWLSTSETGSDCNSVSMYTSTPEKHKSSYSSKPVRINHDDRPVLCALTLEDIKQFSASSTPMKSPSKSPDETPIIGTVGGYWGNHSKTIDCGSETAFKGIPNTTSKYREDKSVNWHSTPFEARLEKALNREK